jgi:hypothetical protein
VIRAAAVAAALTLVAAGCGQGHARAFCGLVDTANGFDPVEAVQGISCPGAEAAVTAIERGRGGWDCSRAMHAAYELDCRLGGRELQVLETVPATATNRGGIVTLAGWTFRIAGDRLEARSTRGRTLDLGVPPFCVTAAPRQALVALGLRATTPDGGCFRAR